MPTRQPFSAQASNTNNYSVSPQPWEALKSELEDLLGQVKDQISEIESDPEPSFSQSEYAAKNSNDNMAQRRQRALANVQNAMQRLDAKKAKSVKKKKKKKTKSNDLQAAISQIRATTERNEPIYDAPQAAARQMQPTQPAPQTHNHEQLDDIIGQIEGLHRSVRDLSGQVNDNQQFEQIEQCILNLGMQIEQTQTPRAQAIGDQLDYLRDALEQLAALQSRQVEHIEQIKEHSADPSTHEHQTRLEDSIRSIYDKFDVLEQNIDRPNSGIETIAKGIAGIARAIDDIQKQDSAGQNERILSEIERVSQRLDRLDEPRDVASAQDLKHEMAGLRSQLVNALEPRFSALETRLDEFSVPVPDTMPGNPEFLKRLDVFEDRMNSAIERVASERLEPAVNSPEIFARLEEFEDRLTSAIERVSSQSIAPSFDGVTHETLKAMENRLSDALQQVRGTETAANAGEEISENVLSAMESRISSAIDRLQQQLPDNSAQQFDGLKAIEDKLANSLGRLEALAEHKVENNAFTPSASVAEEIAPEPVQHASFSPTSLVASETTEIKSEAVQPAADPGETPAHNPLREQNQALTPPPLPSFDDQADQKPPRPRSFLSAEAQDEFSAGQSISSSPPREVAVEREEDDDQAANRKSFIAAARRAAQNREGEQKTANVGSGGLLGKALARLRPEAKPQKEPAQEPQKAEFAEHPTEAAPRIAMPEAELPASPMVEEQTAFESDTDETAPKPKSALDFGENDELPEPRESFLSRNRQPILLGASIVAIIAMGFNYFTQDHQPDADRTLPETAETLSLSDVPRQVNLAEARQSIGDGQQDMPLETTALANIGTSGTQNIDLTASPSAQIDETTTSSIPNSPVAVTPPPVAIGPEALRNAAANGDARAQFEIAMIYAEGKAVPKDSQQAVAWLERSAAQGFASAQHRLGAAYEHGIGVEKNIDLAKLWYLRSAEAGNRMSMHNLAALLASASDDQRDFSGAAHWFEEAAKRGVLDSQFNLGMLYARGLGVSQDFAKSYKWFAIAAAHGDKDAAKARDDIAPSIEAATMSDIKQELAKWQPEKIDLTSNFAPIGTWDKEFNPGKEIAKKEVILNVQIALSKLGFDLGRPDGVVGPKTRDAIKQFERALGMGESGAINPRLLTVLGSQPV